MVATVLRSSWVVRMVLRLVPEHVNVSDVSKMTALALAASVGDAEKVRLLVEMSAPSLVYYADRDGVLPIVHAMRKGHMHLMRLLVPAMVQLGEPHLETGCARLGEVLLDVIRSSGGDGGAPVGSHSMILIEEIKRVGSSAMSVVLSRCVRQVVSACLVACDYDALGEIASAEGMEPDVAMMVVQFSCGCGHGCDEEVRRMVTGLEACARSAGVVLMPGGAAHWRELLRAACQRRHPSCEVIRAVFQMGEKHIGPGAASEALLELVRWFSRNPASMLRTAGFLSQDFTWTSKKFLDCIDCLLDAGADVRTADRHGLTAVQYAALSLNVEVLVFLLSGCLVKVRALHQEVLADPSGPNTLHARTRMARYQVDIDSVLQLLTSIRSSAPESLPRADDAHCACHGCFTLKLEGVVWVLKEWQRGSPPDMVRHMSTIHNHRRPDATLQFAACPIGHLHADETSGWSDDDSYVSESEAIQDSTATDGAHGLDGSDGSHGRGLQEQSRRRWYTGFI